jgi:hypothetical protein
MQWLGKHIPTGTFTHAIGEKGVAYAVRAEELEENSGNQFS